MNPQKELKAIIIVIIALGIYALTMAFMVFWYDLQLQNCQNSYEILKVYENSLGPINITEVLK